MKLLRNLTLVGGMVTLLFAFGFIFRLSFATSIWPWEDGRYSYLFVGSILAAVSAAALWVGWTGEFGALPAGAQHDWRQIGRNRSRISACLSM